jgi:hypothetical protein
VLTARNNGLAITAIARYVKFLPLPVDALASDVTGQDYRPTACASHTARAAPLVARELRVERLKLLGEALVAAVD